MKCTLQISSTIQIGWMLMLSKPTLLSSYFAELKVQLDPVWKNFRKFSESNLMWRKRYRLLLVLSAVSFLICSFKASAEERPFSPISRLTTWFKDTAPIDIELKKLPTSTPGQVPLRFRVSRALVKDITANDDGDVLYVNFIVYLGTGAPVFIDDPDPPSLPQESKEETRAKRWASSISILIRARNDFGDLQKNQVLENCKGKRQSNQLWSYKYDYGRKCIRSGYPNGEQYVAQLDDRSLVDVRCRGPKAWGYGCEIRFPYRGFTTELSFHQSHLDHWRDIILSATKFLDSKRYD